MKFRYSQAISLIGSSLLGASLFGCGGNVVDTAATAKDATALSVSGNLNATSSIMLQNNFSSRIDQLERMLASYPVSIKTTYTQYLISCVTFTVPPVVGTGGTPDASGKFTVDFGAGSVGKSFGCFIVKPTDGSFDAIPLVFQDTTQKSMDGSAKQDTRLAVTGDISIPSINLNLNSGTATVDTTAIVKTDTSASGPVVATATGTKFDFTGNWIVQDPVANGITVPAGYTVPLTEDQSFEIEWTRRTTNSGGGGGGPQQGMQLLLQRLAGKAFTPNAACLTDVANHKNGTASGPLAPCVGTTGTEDRYGIQVWAPQSGDTMSGCTITHPTPAAGEKAACRIVYHNVLAAQQTPAQAYAACGRKMGFTANEAKAMGRVDFTADTNYASSGTTSGASDTKYYDGGFVFATTATVGSGLYGSTVTNGMAPPFSVASIHFGSEGWKSPEAQTQWSQQNNCAPVDVLVGGVPGKAFRCYGTYYPNCAQNDWNVNCTTSGSDKAAFQENAGMGCTDSTGAAINFSNWNEFWCNGASSCTNTCSAPVAVQWVNGGVATDAGYSITSCSQKSTGFTPKDQSGNAITSAVGTISCKNGGGMWDNTTPSTPVLKMGTGVNLWGGQNFRPTRSTAGSLCSGMDTSATAGTPDHNRQVLAQLQCYANAYQRAQNSITGCSRDIQFNYGTQDPWNFVSKNDGPSKARGEVIFELFNYADNNSGSFSTVETREEGLQSKDANGGQTWIPCTVNNSQAIAMTVISSTKLLFEMTTNVALANKNNPTCVAAAADGTLQTGLSKMMWVMTKQ